MASDPDFVQFVVDQMDPDLEVRARKMFGEYGLHAGDVFFGLICEDRLFLKPTQGGRAWIGDADEAPPYPGARPYLVVDDRMEDGPWLSELVRVTVRELPPPKNKKKNKKG